MALDSSSNALTDLVRPQPEQQQSLASSVWQNDMQIGSGRCDNSSTRIGKGAGSNNSADLVFEKLPGYDDVQKPSSKSIDQSKNPPNEAGQPKDSGDLLTKQAEALPDTTKEEIRKQIENLGSNVFKTRDDAQNELVNIGPVVLPFLKDAVKSDDLEVRNRSQAIVEKLLDKHISVPDGDSGRCFPGEKLDKAIKANGTSDVSPRSVFDIERIAIGDPHDPKSLALRESLTEHASKLLSNDSIKNDSPSELQKKYAAYVGKITYQRYLPD